MADPGASTVQQQLYPHPPPYFKLYRGDADGSAERPFPPPPPPPVSGEYVLFGEVHTVSGIPMMRGKRAILFVKEQICRVRRNPEVMTCSSVRPLTLNTFLFGARSQRLGIRHCMLHSCTIKRPTAA